MQHAARVARHRHRELVAIGGAREVGRGPERLARARDRVEIDLHVRGRGPLGAVVHDGRDARVVDRDDRILVVEPGAEDRRREDEAGRPLLRMTDVEAEVLVGARTDAVRDVRRAARPERDRDPRHEALGPSRRGRGPSARLGALGRGARLGAGIDARRRHRPARRIGAPTARERARRGEEEECPHVDQAPWFGHAAPNFRPSPRVAPQRFAQFAGAYALATPG